MNQLTKYRLHRKIFYAILFLLFVIVIRVAQIRRFVKFCLSGTRMSEILILLILAKISTFWGINAQRVVITLIQILEDMVTPHIKVF